MLQQIDIGVTLRNAADVYKEEVVALLLQWLSDMCKVTICGEEDLVRKYVAMALFQPRKQQSPSSFEGTPLAPDLVDLEMTSEDNVPLRFDWFMRLDVRLWRRAKWQLREIYSGIFVLGPQVKHQFASCYSLNYGHTFEHYLYQDRDDSSLTFSMSYMLLGRSAACGAAIVDSDLLESVLDTAFRYYTVSPQKADVDDHIDESRDRFDIESPAFRGKKGLTLLSHLRALLKYKEVKAQLVHSSPVFQKTLNFLNHFVGLQSQRRELEKHVEYEIDWVKSISVLPDLTKLAREFGEAFQAATPKELLQAMHIVLSRIVYDMTLVSSTLDPDHYQEPSWHLVEDVLMRGSSYQLILLDVVRISGFSFHHYMHLVFAEMLKSIRSVCYDQAGTTLSFTDLVEREIIKGANDCEKSKLLLIEWPLESKFVRTCSQANM
jgi:E3 ubiquitin-protein ligase UBR1